MAWYWIVLIVIGAAVVLYTLLSFIVARVVLKMATTPTAHTLDEARAYQTEHEHMDYGDYDNVWKREEFEVDGHSGKVRGEIVFNTTNDNAEIKKVAIVCHGHTWNRINSYKYARIFYDLGYSLVLYDHAYFGLSDGKYTTLGYYECHDLSAVCDMVRDRFGKNAIIALHGESMGAATVLGVLGLRNDITMVVADCPFSNTMKYYREVCLESTHLPGFPIVDFANAMSKRRYGYDFTKYNPIDSVATSNTPICFIHGKADKFIYPKHSEDMYKVCKNSLSELHLVDGAGHARSHVTDPQGYRKIVAEFVAKVEQSVDEK